MINTFYYLFFTYASLKWLLIVGSVGDLTQIHFLILILVLSGLSLFMERTPVPQLFYLNFVCQMQYFFPVPVFKWCRPQDFNIVTANATFRGFCRYSPWNATQPLLYCSKAALLKWREKPFILLDTFLWNTLFHIELKEEFKLCALQILNKLTVLRIPLFQFLLAFSSVGFC